MTVRAVTNRPPELLSRSDKQLAWTNAIGFVSTYSFGKYFNSDASAALKTGAAYANFAIRGANYLWRQHLIGKLPLAQNHPRIKEAVSPLTTAAAHGLALVAANLKEENAAYIGWGLCQVPTIASAATVAHHCLQRLGRCLRNLPSRPKEALQAIPIHVLNLSCELGRAIVYWQNTLGVQEWQKQDQFFEQNIQDPMERDAARFVHAFSNPAWKIASDGAKSQAALEEYLQTLSYAGTQAESEICDTASGADLLKKAPILEVKADLLSKTAPEMTWQATDKANAAFATYKTGMNHTWYLAWKNVGMEPIEKLEAGLNKIYPKTFSQLEKAADAKELFQTYGKRRKVAEGICKKANQNLERWIELLDQTGGVYLDQQGAKYALTHGKLAIEKACKEHQKEIDQSTDWFTAKIQEKWKQRIDAIASGISVKMRDLFERRHHWFANPATYVSQFPELLTSGQSKLRNAAAVAPNSYKASLDAMQKESDAFGDIVKGPLSYLWDIHPAAARMQQMHDWFRKEVQMALQGLQTQSEAWATKLQQAHDEAYLDRGYTTLGPGWWSFKTAGGVVPDSTKHSLSKLEPFDEQLHKDLGCAYVNNVARRLLDQARANQQDGIYRLSYNLGCARNYLFPIGFPFRKTWQAKIDGIEQKLIKQIDEMLPKLNGLPNAELSQLSDLLESYQTQIRFVGSNASNAFKTVLSEIESTNSTKQQYEWVQSRIAAAVKTIQRHCERAATKMQWAHDQAAFGLSKKSTPDVPGRAKYILSRLEPFDEASYQSKTCAYVNELAKPLFDLVQWQDGLAVTKAIEQLGCIDLHSLPFQNEWQGKINAVENNFANKIKRLPVLNFKKTPLQFLNQRMIERQNVIKAEEIVAITSLQDLSEKLKVESQQRQAWGKIKIEAATAAIKQTSKKAIGKIRVAEQEAFEKIWPENIDAKTQPFLLKIADMPIAMSRHFGRSPDPSGLLASCKSMILKVVSDASKSYDAALSEIPADAPASRVAWAKTKVDLALSTIKKACEDSVEKLQSSYDQTVASTKL